MRTHIPYSRHGLTKSITYTSWYAMKKRTCYKDHQSIFPGYQNISICERWKNSFLAFLEDMEERPSRQHSLDRIDNSKGYYPGNCRWALQKTQMRNRSDFNVKVDYAGRLNDFILQQYLLCELADLAGIDQKILRTRLKQGMKIEAALIPINFKNGKPLRKYD